MRYHEISNGLRVLISKEEEELIELVTAHDKVTIERMSNIRHQAVATELVAKGILIKDDNGFVKPNIRSKK